jgi:folate-binding protein YgfZ
MIIRLMTEHLNGVAPLPHLGVIAVAGEDAASFLQGQLTQDFVLLGPGEARLAAYCNPKGRMLASFVGFKRAEDDILLVAARDVLAPTLKRLSMFVLRAKCKLRDATEEFALRGLAGSATGPIGAQPPWTRQCHGDASWVALYPAADTPRALWVAPAGTPAPEGASLSASSWQWGEVMSGVATITAPIAEAFVPQMLNYESVGGVNFRKGCYPGQEVVARSQFRGTLKRRAWLAHAESTLREGQEVFHESDREQPCGVVAEAAESPEFAAGGGWDAIVALQVTAAAEGRLTAGGPDGPTLTLKPAPYPLLADV